MLEGFIKLIANLPIKFLKWIFCDNDLQISIFNSLWRKGDCTEILPPKCGLLGFGTHGPYYEFVIFVLLPVCFIPLQVLREVMMKHWWQGNKMKNSVDGSKNRYGKESTYLRHVFHLSSFFGLFLQCWLNPSQTQGVYGRLFCLRILVHNFWYSFERSERSDFKYLVVSISLVSFFLVNTDRVNSIYLRPQIEQE